MCLSEIVPLLNKFLTLCVCRISNNEIIFGASDEYMNTAFPYDDHFSLGCTELLACISSIFSWAPASEIEMTSEFFNNIFELCMFNPSEKFVSIHIAALMTISELFYLQRKLPQPQIIANGITELIQQHNLTSTAEEYQAKLTELLALFLAQQWTRFANSKEFPSKDFLLYLFNFTFSAGIPALTFTERLATWAPVIQSFNEKEAGRYSETIVQLISNVFKKMQFQFDDQLELLDTESLDENMQTELSAYRSVCISIMSTAAEVEPCRIFDLIHSEFSRDDGNLKVFVALLNSLPDFTKDSVEVQVNLDDLLRHFTHEPLNNPFFLHCLIRDLSTLLQTITQLSSVVLLQSDERFHSISNVIRSCSFALELMHRKKFYKYNLGNESVTKDLIELQAQLLTSIRSLLLLKNDIIEQEISSLVSTLTQILLNRDCDESLLVSSSSAQLMLTITSSIRPNFLLKHPQFLELLQSDLVHLSDPQLRLLCKRIAFNSLLLPYNKIAVNHIVDQEYDKRGKFLQIYVERVISEKFLNLEPVASPSVFEQTKEELTGYEEILATFEDTNTISKQMLLAGIQKVINKAIELFKLFPSNIYSNVVNFFLGVVRCLQLQLGSSFVTEIIRMFLETATVSRGNGEALNKLLQMLIFIVQQSGSSANSLMSDILKMTLDEMLPLEEVSANLYTLYAEILQNHWNYFQKPQPLGSGRNGEEDLLKIFTAYGQFLCNGTNSQDPNVIRIILSSLEKLNEFCRLYEKVFFKNYLLPQFLTCLIRLVVSPGGILFYDQIISITFHMAEKNKSVLLECFAAIGFPEVKIVQQICESSDLPTFSSLMQILVQDTIYSQFLQ